MVIAIRFRTFTVIIVPIYFISRIKKKLSFRLGLKLSAGAEQTPKNDSKLFRGEWLSQR